MGHGWSSDFSPTHFDKFSPPDFFTKVNWIIKQHFSINLGGLIFFLQMLDRMVR